MSPWSALLQKPAPAASREDFHAWFDRIAQEILNGCRLIVARQRYRFTEIEFYYFADIHADSFSHRDPLQREHCRWYFHRSGGVYRGGTFKGVDLTFGDGQARGGILIRGIETPTSELIDGPSLCVDHLLDATGAGTVAALDKAIAGRSGWDAGNPLRLEAVPPENPVPVYRCGRVGLSLKKTAANSARLHFVLRPYRYLTEPKRIKKGKLNLILALHVQGMTAAEIQKITGSPAGTVARYIQEFEKGRREADFTPYIGIDLGPVELCRLHGVWHALEGEQGSGSLFRPTSEGGS